MKQIWHRYDTFCFECERLAVRVMDYEDFFKQQIQLLRGEGNYRVFADIEREAGSFRMPFDITKESCLRRYCLVFQRLSLYGSTPKGDSIND